MMLKNGHGPRIFLDAAAGGAGGGGGSTGAPPADPPAGGAPAGGAPPAGGTPPPAPPSGDGTIATGGGGTPTPAAKPTDVKAADLKRAENSVLDDASVEGIAAFARTHGLSKEQAQQVLSRDEALFDSIAKQQEGELTEKAGQWLQLSQNDPEFGRDKFNESAEIAKRVVNRHASPQLRAVFNETGLGNHPEVIRMLVSIGRASGEDKLISGGEPTPAAGDKGKFKTREQRLFQREKPPDMKQ